MLGLERLRSAGDREHDGSDEPRGCARWERGDGALLRVCEGMRFTSARVRVSRILARDVTCADVCVE